MATAQPGPCRCWTTMGWRSEDGGERGRGTARHGAKVGVTWGWHRVHVACPGQGTEHRQGDTGGGREPAPPPLIFGAKALLRCRLFFGAPWHGAAEAGEWDASERAGLQPATDFTIPGVLQEGEEGSRQRVRIPSQGLPLIPFLARESLG